MDGDGACVESIRNARSKSQVVLRKNWTKHLWWSSCLKRYPFATAAKSGLAVDERRNDDFLKIPKV